MASPTFDVNDPNFWTDLLTHLGKSSDPNFAANLQQYGQQTGIDPTQRYPGYNIARYLMPLLYKQLASQMAYQTGVQPLGQAATTQALAALTNPDKAATEFQQQASAQGQSTLQTLLQRIRAGGGPAGAELGAAQSTANEAASAGNQFRAQQASPSGLSQRLSAILGTISGAAPDFTSLYNLNSLMTGTPRNATGAQAIGGILGNLSATIPMGKGSLTL